MSEPAAPRIPVAAVGIVCLRGDELLLVRRGKAPLAGQWSLPGGRIEWGERARDAALRELMEETGCAADLIGLIDVVDGLMSRAGESLAAAAEPWGHYVLIDYAARWVRGEPRAGDDAIDSRFFAPHEISGLNLWTETARVIQAARVMLAGA